jgi:two-component system, OmpR family, KDP operon response regulator KdpE
MGERPIFRSGDLSVDLIRRIVRVRAMEIKLTPKTYELLRILVHHAGKVLRHRLLLRELWSENPDFNYLRACVRQLRQKIEVDPRRPEYVLTENGVGYRSKQSDGGNREDIEGQSHGGRIRQQKPVSRRRLHRP